MHAYLVPVPTFSNLNFTDCHSSGESALYGEGDFSNGCPCSYWHVEACSADAAIYHTSEGRVLNVEFGNFYANQASVAVLRQAPLGNFDIDSCVFNGNGNLFSFPERVQISNCVFDILIPEKVVQGIGNTEKSLTASWYLYPADVLVCVIFPAVPSPDEASVAPGDDPPLKITPSNGFQRTPVFVTEPIKRSHAIDRSEKVPHSLAIGSSLTPVASAPFGPSAGIPLSNAARGASSRVNPDPSAVFKRSPVLKKSTHFTPSDSPSRPPAASDQAPPSGSPGSTGTAGAVAPAESDNASEPLHGSAPLALRDSGSGEIGNGNDQGSSALGAALGGAGAGLALLAAGLLALILLKRSDRTSCEVVECDTHSIEEMAGGDFVNPLTELEGGRSEEFFLDVIEGV
jgi:hypothetical protein